jgi:hypothetical protein
LDLFAIEIGRRVAMGLLEDEVNQLCGPRHAWGREGTVIASYFSMKLRRMRSSTSVERHAW